MLITADTASDPVAVRALLEAAKVANGRAAAINIPQFVPKVGRSDPRPCGSGMEYKHCHGKLA